MLEPRSERPIWSTPPYLPDSDDWFALEDWVGADRPSRRDDVAKIEALLAASGDLSFERTQGPTGYWGLTQDAALRRYQKRHGLVPDGALRPGGPTITDMGERYGAMFAGQTPPAAADIDAHHDALARGDAALIAWDRDEAGANPLGTLVAMRREDPAKPRGAEGTILERFGGGIPAPPGAAGRLGRGINLHEDRQPKIPDKGFKEELIPPPIPDPNDTGGFTPVEPKPNHTGHAAPEPVGVEPLVNVPEMPDGVREEFIGNVAETFGVFLRKLVYGDGKTENRAGYFGALGTNIQIKACIDDIKEVGAEGKIVHKGGGSLDGGREEYMKETTITGKAGTNRSDDAFGKLEATDPHEFSHFNTASTRKDGTLTPREHNAIERIAKNIGLENISFMRKFREGDDPDEYYREAKGVCRKGLMPLYKQLGLNPPPTA
jgi:hypothetical protein